MLFVPFGRQKAFQNRFSLSFIPRLSGGGIAIILLQRIFVFVSNIECKYLEGLSIIKK